MKIKLKFIYFLTLILVFNFSYSQEAVGNGFDDQIGSGSFMISTSSSRKNVKVEGSPYVNDQFLPITITSFENKVFKGRYNAFNGDFEVMDDATGKSFVLNRAMENYEVKFVGTNLTYIILKHIHESGEVTNDFFVKLTASNYNYLLKKESVQFLGERLATSTYDKARPAQYKRSKDTYYLKSDDEIKEVSTNKKDIAKLFPTHSKTILDYIKSEKIKTNKEEDLIRLFNYINTL